MIHPPRVCNVPALFSILELFSLIEIVIVCVIINFFSAGVKSRPTSYQRMTDEANSFGAVQDFGTYLSETEIYSKVISL